MEEINLNIYAVKFEYDKQTIKDLEIFKDYHESSPSIFTLYDHTITHGGSDVLADMMKKPISDLIVLESRVELFKYLIRQQIELSIKASQLEYIEKYLSSNITVFTSNPIYAVYKSVSESVKPTNAYYLVKTGIQQLLLLLAEINRKLDFDDYEMPALLQEGIGATRQLLLDERVVTELTSYDALTAGSVCRLDHLFRFQLKNEVKAFISEVYHLDAFTSVAKAAKQNGFNLPNYQNRPNPSFTIKQLRHPLLRNAVPYDIEMGMETNMYFLTGPNMAGKSTFLKALGLAIYLSHLGFPVAVSEMTTSVYSGIITTINLSDDINLGYSHFYSEVQRVKKTAIALADSQPLFVIFDELFRGTNVKDAFEGSSEIIKAFAQVRNSTFYVSTHIVEVAEELMETKNICFKHFGAALKNGLPTYDYKLKDGLSTERMGMHIIKKEGIIEILNELGRKRI